MENKLTPEKLIEKIYKAEIGIYGMPPKDIPTIEIHCSERRQKTTSEEKDLLTSNGYVEMFDYLVVGWDMWCLKEDAIKMNLEPVNY